MDLKRKISQMCSQRSVLLLMFMCSLAIFLSALLVEAQVTEINVSVGQTATLPCRTPGAANNYVVMWLDQNGQVLSQNTDMQTSDKRFSIIFTYSTERNLRIESVRSQDSGAYKCVITRGGAPENENTVRLSVLVPPQITKVSPDVTIATNADVTLTCIATGTPQPNITWFLHRHLQQSAEVFPITVAGSAGTWKLSSMKCAAAGRYECKADNGVQPAATSSFRIDVTCPPTIRTPYRVIRQSMGSDTLLQCISMGNPAPEVQWQVKGQILAVSTGQDKYKVHQGRTGEYSNVVGLEVRHLAQDDCTAYTCIAKNAHGQASAEVMNLMMEAWKVESVIAKISQTVTLPCSLQDQSNATKSVIWYFQEKVIYSSTSGSTNQRYTIVSRTDLKIASVEISDAGEYRCETSEDGQSTVSLTITDGDSKCSSSLGSQIYLGRTLGLTCSLTYHGPPPSFRVQWTHEPTGQTYDGIVRTTNQGSGSTGKKMEGDLLLQAELVHHGRFRCDIQCRNCGEETMAFKPCSYDVNILPTSASSCSGDASAASMAMIPIIAVLFIVIVVLVTVGVFLVKKYKGELIRVTGQGGPGRRGSGPGDRVQPTFYRHSIASQT